MLAAHILDAAFGYVDRSAPWPLFPADAKTKRPLIATGRDHAEHASIDLETIRAWFGSEFTAFGMPTGAASGTVVIDADAKHDGEQLLAVLEAELGALPRTHVVRTQSGGLHLYFAHPGGVRVRTGAGPKSPLGRLLGELTGVDVRADGGIVILPPSCGYRWIADEDGPLPALPALWLAAIQGAGEPPAPPRPTLPPRPGERRWCDPDKVAVPPEGGRNDALYDRGVALRIAGATDSEIVDDLERLNARCSTPLSAREVAKIAASAARATGRRA